MVLGEMTVTGGPTVSVPINDGPVRLFVSYSHLDERHRAQLVKHLLPCVGWI